MSTARSAAWIAAAAGRGEEVDGVAHAGHSMAPCLLPGDLLTIAPVSRLRAGAILVARCGDRLVAHRLVRWSSAGVVLRGDANRADDPPFAAGTIVGEVRAARRDGQLLPLGRAVLDRVLAPARRLARGLRG